MKADLHFFTEEEAGLKDPTIGFPQSPLRVKDRRYWLEADLIAWERAQLPRGDEECAR